MPLKEPQLQTALEEAALRRRARRSEPFSSAA
jgi:hypothetical protein